MFLTDGDNVRYVSSVAGWAFLFRLGRLDLLLSTGHALEAPPDSVSNAKLAFGAG